MWELNLNWMMELQEVVKGLNGYGLGFGPGTVVHAYNPSTLGG